MTDINIKFLHPVDMRPLEVELDDAITAQGAIDELISEQFVAATSDGYRLSIKGGNEIQAEQTFNAAGVKNNDTLLVIPQTDAGYIHMESL